MVLNDSATRDIEATALRFSGDLAAVADDLAREAHSGIDGAECYEAILSAWLVVKELRSLGHYTAACYSQAAYHFKGENNMTKTLAVFGLTLQALNTAMNTISGLNTSPPCIILLSKLIERISIHHD